MNLSWLVSSATSLLADAYPAHRRLIKAAGGAVTIYLEDRLVSSTDQSTVPLPPSPPLVPPQDIEWPEVKEWLADGYEWNSLGQPVPIQSKS